MIILRKLRNLRKIKLKSEECFHTLFFFLDSFIVMMSLVMLIFTGVSSTCLSQFFLFMALIEAGQALAHFLLLKMPKTDVVLYQNLIKRLTTLLCVIQIVYLLLVIIFWQRSTWHPIYCAMCQEFHLPYLIGIGYVIHFVFTLGILVTLIHGFVTRKYYLIALGGFEVEQRLTI